MTNQSDIKKLAEQMAGSMNSFDDIKDFQKQLMQSFIDTALEAEMEDHLGYPKHEKADKPNKRGTLKRGSAVTQAISRYPPQETVIAALSLYWSANIKPVSQVSMIKSYSTTGIALRLALRASVSQTLADPRSYAKGKVKPPLRS